MATRPGSVDADMLTLTIAGRAGATSHLPPSNVAVVWIVIDKVTIMYFTYTNQPSQSHYSVKI